MRATKTRRRWPPVIRAGARGLVAAMAMTGTRTVTAAVGPHEKSPPQAIVEEHAPKPVLELPARQRQAFTELAHWSYGAAGGIVFGMLPRRIRARAAAGPLYGLALWLTFELAIAPVLGVQHTRNRQALWRGVIAFDHILYGVMVAGRLAPEPLARP